MLDKYNLVEFFSGIGSQYKALTNLGVKVNTLATCEWDIHAIIAYDFLHGNGSIPEEIAELDKVHLMDFLKLFTFSNSGKKALDEYSLSTYSKETLQHIYASIVKNNNYVDITTLTGKRMPSDIDILTYSFPCQDLSCVGALHGYKKGIDKNSGSRSSLLWQVGRILDEMKAINATLPRFLVMENVPALLSCRHRTNFEAWISELNKLGYISKAFELNASSFGLPQNRPRLLMISVFVGENIAERKFVEKYFNEKDSDKIIEDYRCSQFFHEYSVQDFLRINYINDELRQEAIECTPNDTISRRKIWEDNPQIVLPGNKFNEDIKVVRTITTKQDRNPNSGNLYFESGIKGLGTFRYLTPRECMLFMGFEEADYLKLKYNNIEFHKGDALFSRDKIIRMVGNSIPVKLLEGIFLQVLKIDNIIHEFNKLISIKSSDSSKTDAYLSEIRSYLFAHGLRSRKNTYNFAKEASIVYPHYKTAVFVLDCFSHCHSCIESIVYRNNQNVTNENLKNHLIIDKESYTNITEKGWNALVIFFCNLENGQKDITLKWLETHIKSNLNSKTKQGEVLLRD